MENLLQQAGAVSHTLYAVAFGLLLSSFTWYIIYLDSSIPGVNPPTPFSASKKRYRGGPPSGTPVSPTLHNGPAERRGWILNCTSRQ
uniref:Uncharacterized protein n=1 Tax=Anopheles coluzzii TaxID=1518534 RepID=A0A6E8W7C2_ANOCL